MVRSPVLQVGTLFIITADCPATVGRLVWSLFLVLTQREKKAGRNEHTWPQKQQRPCGSAKHRARLHRLAGTPHARNGVDLVPPSARDETSPSEYAAVT